MTWNQGNDQDREREGESSTPSWTTDGWQRPEHEQTDSGSSPAEEDAAREPSGQGQQPDFGEPYGSPVGRAERAAGWQPAPVQSDIPAQQPDGGAQQQAFDSSRTNATSSDIAGTPADDSASFNRPAGDETPNRFAEDRSSESWDSYGPPTQRFDVVAPTAAVPHADQSPEAEPTTAFGTSAFGGSEPASDHHWRPGQQDLGQGEQPWNPGSSQGESQWSQDHRQSEQPWQQVGQQPGQQDGAPTQVFGAPPAAFPGDQNVPFQDPQQGGGPGGGGPGDYGPGGPGDSTQSSGGSKRPFYRRKGFIILAIVVVAVLLIAAIAIPLIIHQRNVDRGDNLAATFNNALEEYNATWNADNLAAVSAVNLSDPISAANRAWYDLNQEDREALDLACADVQPALEKRTELAETTVPELPQEDAAEASEAYRQAQQDAEAVTAQRSSAEEFLSGSENALGQMSEFCTNYGAYADLYDTFEGNVAGVLAEAYVVEQGGRIETSDGSVYYQCDVAEGCANLYEGDTREQFAAAMETTYVGYYQGLAELYSSQCFMSEFADACAVAATDYQAVADAYQAIIDHLRNTEPTVAVGEVLYPELEALGTAASDAEIAAETNFITEWQKVEPGAYSLSTTGTSLGTVFADKTTSIQELATAALGE